VPPAEVLDRSRELGRLDDAFGRAGRRGGDGAVLVLEGPAGIGRTALLRAARESARSNGLTVLSAVASALDRDFPFGLVHQLLGPVLAGAGEERRRRLLDGGAAAAATVLSPTADPDLPPDPGFAVLHGLYWLAANLADEQPVALLVDDLHWADRASLRWLEYLGRRLDGVPVVVVATLRPQEPGADVELLGAVQSSPGTETLVLRTLSEDAVGAIVERALGAAPDAAFREVVAQVTGGNPLLVRALAEGAAEAGLRGTAGEAARVAELDPPALGPVIQRRLQALGGDALTLARAAAVLGGRGSLEDLGEVAGLDAQRAAAAADRLAAAELLEGGTWAFVHPLVREAVLDALPAARRAQLHEAAARRLAGAGAPPGEIAVHLLATEPGTRPGVAATLRAAARRAAAEGAADVAVAQLRRALAELRQAPTADRSEILLELGELEVRAGAPEAEQHLVEALDAGLTGDAAARARTALGVSRMLRAPLPALTDFEQAMGEATDPDLRMQLESRLLEGTVYHSSLLPRRRALLDAGRADPDASPVMAAHLAMDSAYRGRPAAETIAYADRAHPDEVLRVIGPENSTYNLLFHALRYAEQPDRSLALLEAGDAAARRAGSRFQTFFLEHAWAYWHLQFGSVQAGIGQAQTGFDKVLSAGFPMTIGAFGAIVAELLVELDRIDDAARVVDALDPEVDETVAGPFAVTARGLVRWVQQRRELAEADLRRAVELLDSRGWHAPLVTGARLRLAMSLAERGERDEALSIATTQVEVALAAGTTGALGASLRAQGRAQGGDEGIELLAQAAEMLGRTPLTLEHGWALHDLGAALRRTGRRADARTPLRAALDVAARTESALLGRHAREELEAAGGKALRSALSGPASLTPSERRVAELAASGLSNREIAETLWVTQKTVEVHLSHTYAKLGIRTRGQLTGALEPAPAAA
jgi:DNA-binding CsgD family transcriptional regulator